MWLPLMYYYIILVPSNISDRGVMSSYYSTLYNEVLLTAIKQTISGFKTNSSL